MRVASWFLCVVGFVIGCSSAEPGPASTSCDAVCANIAARCGATPAGCATACGSLSSSVRACVAGATSCASIDACGTAPTPDAGMSNDAPVVDPNPCSRCTGIQFCVRNAAREVTGCWTPPDTCNDRPSESCDTCAYGAGSGPCSAGASACSSGAAGRVIDCM